MDAVEAPEATADVTAPDALDASPDAGRADADAPEVQDVTSDTRVCPTEQTLCGADCVDTRTNVMHCGGCGRTCAAGQSCCSGACVDTQQDVTRCGSCTNVCAALPRAMVACVAGACRVGNCTTGWGDCDGVATNGCETNVLTVVTDCGACGATCAPSNAVPACVAGACRLGSCLAGFYDCDGSAMNGCEITTAALLTSAAHCGRCGNACPTPTNATATCASGACGFTCNGGFGNCDSNVSNGCETNLSTSALHCGACGRACRARGRCIAGACIEQLSCQTAGTPGCGVVDVVGNVPFTQGGDPLGGELTPQVNVRVGHFVMDRYEVTVARFRRYWEAGHPVGERVVRYPGETAAGVNVPWNPQVTEPLVRNPGAVIPYLDYRFCNWTASASDREGHPINCVDWYTAQAFCVWDGGLPSTNPQTGRLPTEAEWEFAARGTEGRPWPWGTTMVASQGCWNRCPTFPTNCLGTCLEEDASFLAGATPTGVWHMAGNVSEWTVDNQGIYSTRPSSDPCVNRSNRLNPICFAGDNSRMRRGGAWDFPSSSQRSASRGPLESEACSTNLGFRCVGTVTE